MAKMKRAPVRKTKKVKSEKNTEQQRLRKAASPPYSTYESGLPQEGLVQPPK